MQQHLSAVKSVLPDIIKFSTNNRFTQKYEKKFVHKESYPFITTD